MHLLRIITYMILLTATCSCSAGIQEDKMAISLMADSLVDNPKLLEILENAGRNSANRDKSIGVFGGSLSSNPESVYAKWIWQKYLDVKVTTYGTGGNGYSSLQGSIQDQVRKAGKHDIYILWSSTNDYTAHREVGEATDYTEADGYDESKLVTQCGGMNYCIRMLREKNPKATIYIFGSLKFFEHDGGFSLNSTITNKIGRHFGEYIEKQQEVANLQGVKFFNQFEIPVCTIANVTRYYKPDLFHMTETGYANIGVYQAYFLATETEINSEIAEM